MPAEKKILKYLKIKALADSGTGGERTNAGKLIAKMEKEDPSLAKAAQAYQSIRNSQRRTTADPEARQPRPPPPPPPSDGYTDPGSTGGASGASGPWGATGNWENIFSWADTAYQNVRGFAETVANAAAGRNLAKQVRSSFRITSAGNVLLTLRFPVWVYHETENLNPFQQQAFREALHELLDDEIDEFLD